MRNLLLLIALCVSTAASAQLSGLYYYADNPLGGPIELLLKSDGTFQERNNTCAGAVLYKGTYTYDREGILYLYQERMFMGKMRNTKRKDHFKFKGNNLQRLDLDLLYLKQDITPENLKEDAWTVKG